LSDAVDQEIVIGRIGGVYGVKGWVKIHSFTEPAENLLCYRGWKIRRRDRDPWESIDIDEGRRHGKGLIAHVAGIDDRDAAEALKGCEIAVPRIELPPLEGDEYYWHQLEGLEVVCGDVLLGRVDHLLETGANDVLVVRGTADSIDDRERLIPWIRGQVVKRVDIDAGRIDVEWDPEF
jgi:16S rRNA processing protein RimM